MRHPWRSFTLAGLLALLIAVLLCAPSTLAATPEEDPSLSPAPHGGYACDGGDGVYLYGDIDYAGDCIKFTADDPELGDDGWHDKASSIRFVGFMYAGAHGPPFTSMNTTAARPRPSASTTPGWETMPSATTAPTPSASRFGPSATW